MAWSVPLTAVSGTALTAAQWNASVRDNLLETAAAKATTATGIFVATGTNTLSQRVPGSAGVTTNQSTSSTSFTDLTTVGPQVSVVTGIAAIVFFGAWLTNDTGGARSTMSYAVSGSTTVAAADNNSISVQITTSSSACYVGTSRTYLHTGLTAGTNTFTAKYKVSTGNGDFQQRTLGVIGL